MASNARRGATALLLLAAVALGCDAPTAVVPAPRYDPTGLTGGIVYHWEPGATIRVYADQTGLDTTDFNVGRAVLSAGKVWRSAVYFREVNLDLVSLPSDADVIVHYRFAPRLVNTVVGGSDCNVGSGAGAYTLFCPDVGPALVLPLLGGGAVGHVKMDIYVDPFAYSQAYLNQRGINIYQAFYSMVAHEIGHALGIGGHSDDENDLMFPLPTAPGPTDRDAAVLRYILHQPADIRF